MAENYYSSGILCYDKYGGVFMKWGGDILRVTAMTVFDGMVVLGIGTDGAPNLLYLDKDKVTERQVIASNTSDEIVFASEWYTKTLGHEENEDWVLRRVKRIEITYYDNRNYVHHASSSGFKVYYRIDDEIDTTQTCYYTSKYLPKWTLIDAADPTVPLPDTDANKDHIHKFIMDRELDKEAYLWQFKMTSDYDFRILDFKVWLDPAPMESE